MKNNFTQFLASIDAQGPYVGDRFQATNSAVVTVVCVEGERVGYTVPRHCAGHGRTIMVSRAQFAALYPERV